LSEAVLAQAPAAIIVAGCDGLIRSWNHAAEAVFGYSAAEVVGSSLDVIIPERFRDAHWEAFRQAIASGECRNDYGPRTTRAIHKLGRPLYVDLSFGLLKDPSGAVVGSVAVGRDCTARYLAAKAQRQQDN